MLLFCYLSRLKKLTCYHPCCSLCKDAALLEPVPVPEEPGPEPVEDPGPTLGEEVLSFFSDTYMKMEERRVG